MAERGLLLAAWKIREDDLDTALQELVLPRKKLAEAFAKSKLQFDLELKF